MSHLLRRPWFQALVCGLALGTIHFLMTVNDPFSVDDMGLQYLLSRTWARRDSLFAHWDVLYPIGQYSYFGSLMKQLGEGLFAYRLGGSALIGIACSLLFSSVRQPGGVLLGFGVALAPLLAGKPQAPALLAMALVANAALGIARADSVSRSTVLMVSILAGALLGWREDSAILAGGVAVFAATRRGRVLEGLGLIAAGLGVGFSAWLGVMTVQGEPRDTFTMHVLHRVTFLFSRLLAPTKGILDAAGSGKEFSLRGLVGAATPLLVAGLLFSYLALLGREAWCWRRDGQVRRIAVVGALVGLAYLPQFAWERPDFFHFFTHLPAFVLAMASTATQWPDAFRQRFAGLLCMLLGAAVAVRGVEMRLHQTVPYPTAAAARIGARVRADSNSLPPWAGLPRNAGDTLIVLGWGPGWYVLEDYPAGTRILTTHVRHLASEETRARLKEDLLRPTVRWVLAPDNAAPGEWLSKDMAVFFHDRFERTNPQSTGMTLWKRQDRRSAARAP